MSLSEKDTQDDLSKICDSIGMNAIKRLEIPDEVPGDLRQVLENTYEYMVKQGLLEKKPIEGKIDKFAYFPTQYAIKLLHPED